MMEESTQSRGKRFKYARTLTGLSVKHFAMEIYVHLNTVKLWEANKFPEKKIDTIVQHLHRLGVICSADWLLSGTGSMPYRIDKQSINKILTRPPQLKEDIRNKEASFFLAQTSNRIIYQIADNSMSPTYQLGDFVGGEQYFEDSIGKCQGKECIVQTELGDTLCRIVLKGDEKNHYHLRYLNAKAENATKTHENVALISAAPVIWIRRLS